MRRLLTMLIRLYQCTLSPLLGPCCRFYPSCSQYCMEAVQAHGCIRGLWLGIKRILKCHPFHPGGVDLVPAPGGKTGPGKSGHVCPGGPSGPEDGSISHG